MLANLSFLLTIGGYLLAAGGSFVALMDDKNNTGLGFSLLFAAIWPFTLAFAVLDGHQMTYDAARRAIRWGR